MLEIRGCSRKLQALVLLSTLACGDAPIAWEPIEYLPSGGAAAATTTAAAEAVASDERLCARTEIEHGGVRFRAGWDRGDGDLVLLKSPDGGATWEPPVVADARRQEGPPCDRPAPALFADSSNGFLHVAYFAEVPREAGVYYVHSMDAGRLAQTGVGMFESPIPVTFGTRPARTGVASRGDTVIVVYEDPNSVRGAVQLALSVTAGHSFERRVGVPGSAGSHPSVALRSGRVTVQWREAGGTGRLVRRTGSFR